MTTIDERESQPNSDQLHLDGSHYQTIDHDEESPQTTDSEGLVTVKSCAQLVCGMTLNVAVKFGICIGIVVLVSAVTGVTVHRHGFVRHQKPSGLFHELT